MTYILQTNQLSKAINGKQLIEDVNIHVKKGEIYGFLGPNGAGKTTVMKIITNIWKPTTGTVELFGEKLTPKSYDVLKRIGNISVQGATNDIKKCFRYAEWKSQIFHSIFTYSLVALIDEIKPSVAFLLSSKLIFSQSSR